MVNRKVIIALSLGGLYLAGSGELLAEGDLDRWQLHRMAAEAIEVDDQYFSADEQNESSLAEAKVLEASTQEVVEPTASREAPPQVAATPPAPIPAVVEPSKPTPAPAPRPKKAWFSKRKKEPTIECLRAEAHALAKKGLKYQFGSDDPKSGGLDCSATVQYLYSSLGIQGVPRTSYLQYEWLKKAGTLHEVKGKNSTRQLLKRLRPGDLIFWGGTWKSGHKVSHVMIYLGHNPNTGEHFVFGARGKRVEGLLGSGVDVFVLNPERGTLVGHGRVPGMRNS